METYTREKMLAGVTRMVAQIAGRYQGRGVPMEDLIQGGWEGALVALNAYDPARGIKYATFAHYWIEKKVQVTVNNEGRDIRLPKWYHEQRITPIERVADELRQSLGREPTPEEIASDEGLRDEMNKEGDLLALVTETLNWSRQVPLDIDDELLEIIDQAAGPEEEAAKNIDSDRLNELLSELSSDEQDVLRYRFGFIDGDTWTLRQTAIELGLSFQRVGRLEKSALFKMRRNPRTRSLFGN